MVRQRRWIRVLGENPNDGFFVQNEIHFQLATLGGNEVASFNLDAEAKMHQYTRHRQRAHLRCEICERVFQYPSQLRDHMLIHTRIRRFVCQVCGMKFMKEHHLKSHQMTHSSIKPFSCPICGRCFSLKANMERHTLIHNSERRFRCEQCSKSFSQPQTLKMHMISHAEVKPYSCHICGKGLTRAHNLRAHMAIHQNSKPFKCHMCTSSFTLKGNMQRHLKEKHGITLTELESLQHSDVPTSTAGESFILTLDPADTVVSPATSRSEEDTAQGSAHSSESQKQRKNPPKRIKSESPGTDENMNENTAAEQGVHHHHRQMFPINPGSTTAETNMLPAPNCFQQVLTNPALHRNEICPLPSSDESDPVKCRALAPYAIPHQYNAPHLGAPHHSVFSTLALPPVMSRPQGFYTDNGILPRTPSGNLPDDVQVKLQTLHSAVNDLAEKLTCVPEKVAAVHAALDDMVNFHRNPNSSFRCLKTEGVGN